VTEGRRERLAGSVPGDHSDWRVRAFRALLITAFAAMVLLPPVIVSISGSASEVPLFTALRILGLEAFTLIFVNIVTGALSRWFYRLFKPRNFQRFHIACGSLGFLMALAHGIIVVWKRYWSGYNAIWVVGPVALVLLAVTVFVALDRKRLKHVWRRIHQINYLIFMGVFAKTVVIGTDLATGRTYSLVLKTVFIIYAVVATLATVVRIWSYEVQARKKRTRAGLPTG
jgi:Kef-type K+ transport system membrane component KefB